MRRRDQRKAEGREERKDRKRKGRKTGKDRLMDDERQEGKERRRMKQIVIH